MAGELEPVAPRVAATVALIRDTAAGPEVYMLRRVQQMAFAAGMHVFPGGSVEPGDDDAGADWAGPGPGWWAHRFGTTPELAAQLVRAAVRETFEESGVVLAGPSFDEIVEDVAGPDWELDRVELEAGRQSLAQLLTRRRLVLRSDLLAPIAHWITPEAEPRRFDTYFFVATLPPGQECRDVGTEADQRVWIRPVEALTGTDSGELRLMQPTRAILEDLARHPDVESALHAERPFGTVQPRMELRDGQVRLVVGP